MKKQRYKQGSTIRESWARGYDWRRMEALGRWADAVGRTPADELRRCSDCGGYATASCTHTWMPP